MIIIRPSQKLGTAWAVTAIPRANLSIIVLGLSAAKIPSGIAITIVTKTDIKANVIVSGALSKTRIETGLFQ